MSELEKMNEAEIHEAATEEPVGCPSLAPVNLPSGADGTPPAELTDAEKAAARHEYFNRKVWTFCDGLFPIRHISTPEGFFEQCDINGRRFRTSVVIDEVKEDWVGRIYDKDLCVCQLDGLGKGKIPVVKMTHAALRAYVKSLCGTGKYRKGRHYLEQARERAAAKSGEVK